MLIYVLILMRAKGPMTARQVISAQTFCLLFYQLRSPRWVVWVVLVFASALVVMFTLIGPVAYRNNANGDFCE